MLHCCWVACLSQHYFLPSGYSKLTAFSSVVSSLAAKGLPYPEIMAGVLVAAEFLGPLALIIGLWPRWTALALIGFTAATLWMTYGSSVTGTALPSQAEYGVLPEPLDHWRSVLLFRQWTGRMEPDQPSISTFKLFEAGA